MQASTAKMLLTDAELAVTRLEALKHPRCLHCQTMVQLVDEEIDHRVRETLAVLSPEVLA